MVIFINDACYQSIMQAAHSSNSKCMLTLLMIGTVTAHMMYILHLWTCYPLIMHILHDIDLSCSLTWHQSLMYACWLVKMLSIYNNDTVHMMYVLHIWTCYRLIMPILYLHDIEHLCTYACYQSMYTHCISLMDACHRSMLHPVHIIRCMLQMLSTVLHSRHTRKVHK
jgi:hypothetical protein